MMVNTKRLFLVLIISILLLSSSCAKPALVSYPQGSAKRPVDLLVVTHDSLLSVAKDFASEKESSGIKTVVVTTRGVDANFSGKDLPEKIRNCAGEFQKCGAKSILLLGSYSLVPGRYVFCPDFNNLTVADAKAIEKKAIKEKNLEKFERYFVPTDLYYANFSESWDLNGNGIFGEVKALTGLSADEGGFSCQMNVGRIPASNEQEASLYLEKLRNFHLGKNKKVLIVNATKDGGPLFDGDELSRQIIQSLGEGWSVDLISEGMRECTPSRIRKMLDSGDYISFIALAHGFPFGIVVNSIGRLNVLTRRKINLMDSESILNESKKIEEAGWYKKELSGYVFDNEDALRLKNNIPFFLMAFGCYVTAPEYKNHSILENFVVQKHGAIAACGLSRVVTVSRETYEAALSRTGGLQFELGTSIIENVFKKGMTFGEAHSKAIEEYARRNATLLGSSDQREILFGMSLLGDPTINLRQGRE